MPIALDHVFICCEPGGPEAEAMLALGLTEGSRNMHPGQGTANRRFFFHGGFIELLWVSDASEAQSPLTAPTRLWERWTGRAGSACPFGIAFSPTGALVPEPPFETWPYRPAYLPAGKAILFAENTSLQEPELFYLAWPSPQASSAQQPKTHLAPLVRMQTVSVGLPTASVLSRAAQAANSTGLIQFHESRAYELIVRFEARSAVSFDLRPTLGLILQGVA
jgi:hypothetical protein